MKCFAFLLAAAALAFVGVAPAGACPFSAPSGAVAPAFVPAVAVAVSSVSCPAPAVALAVTPCPAAVVQSLASYPLPQAVLFLSSSYGYSQTAAVELLRVHGHAAALAFAGDPAEIVVDKVRGGRNGGRFAGRRKKVKIKIKR